MKNYISWFFSAVRVDCFKLQGRQTSIKSQNVTSQMKAPQEYFNKVLSLVPVQNRSWYSFVFILVSSFATL